MGIALKSRRVVAAQVEAVRGTAEVVTASADGIPLIREAEHQIQPTSVDRDTLRLSLTDYADIYPGKSLVTLTIAVEVAGRDTGFPVTPPSWTRLLRACAMAQAGNAAKVRAYRISVLTTDNGPLRHGEALKGSVGSTALGGADGDNVPFGDAFSHDGGVLTTIFIDEGATDGDGVGTISSNRGSNETVFTADQRSASNILGYRPQSDVNAQVSATIDIYLDGKKIQAKGCAGNCEFQFNHGDAAVARFTMQGIAQVGSAQPKGYFDIAIPTDGYEGHRVPPTFLGTRLSLSATTNNPGTPDRYATGGTASFGVLGSLNQVTLETGNTVILQPNSLDPDGVSFAFITDRAPQGKFNPTEVLNSEFEFISRFIAGTPARMHILLGGTLHTDVTTFDQNSFEFFTPGIVLNQMGDADRDGVNVWDASFRMRGGDYDTTATGELPGSDNEFVIMHR